MELSPPSTIHTSSLSNPPILQSGHNVNTQSPPTILFLLYCLCLVSRSRAWSQLHEALRHCTSTVTMAPNGLKQLANALATPDQLSNSSSSIDGVPPELEASIRCAGAQLTQSAGVLLHLSQDIIAQAIVIFTRFWLGADGGSLRIYSVKVRRFSLKTCRISFRSANWPRTYPPQPST